jgi:hypothetical protein
VKIELPVRPTLLENILFLKMNRGPGPLFDLFGAGAFRALAIGVKLGLFDMIKTGALTSSEVAFLIKCDAHSTEILLEFLCSLGYLRKRSGKYENTALSKKWILRDSDVSLKDMISAWDNEVFPFWDQNRIAVMKTGTPMTTLYETFDTKPEAWQSFNSFEMAIARWLKVPLLSLIKLDSAEKSKLLDIGGGHGLYSVIFCEKYPQLTATVFDREQPLQVARKNIDTSNLQNRIKLRQGDLLNDDYGDGYDVALLFNVLHNFSARENLEILKKASKALSSQGSIVIFDNLAGPGMSKRTIDFFSLAYLVTVGGRCYALEEVKQLLGQAKFTNMRTFLRLPGLVKAVKTS